MTCPVTWGEAAFMVAGAIVIALLAAEAFWPRGPQEPDEHADVDNNPGV